MALIGCGSSLAGRSDPLFSAIVNVYWYEREVCVPPEERLTRSLPVSRRASMTGAELKRYLLVREISDEEILRLGRLCSRWCMWAEEVDDSVELADPWEPLPQQLLDMHVETPEALMKLGILNLPLKMREEEVIHAALPQEGWLGIAGYGIGLCNVQRMAEYICQSKEWDIWNGEVLVRRDGCLDDGRSLVLRLLPRNDFIEVKIHSAMFKTNN